MPPVAAGHIVLSITDLLPQVTDDRVLDFDLALYARGLQMSRGQMALGRLVEARRRLRGRRAGDAEYRPVMGDAGGSAA